MQQLQMNPPWEWSLINLINSYLAFFFFPFSYDNVIAIRCIFIYSGFHFSVCEKRNIFLKQFHQSVKKPEGFSCFESNFFFIRNLFKKVMVRLIGECYASEVSVKAMEACRLISFRNAILERHEIFSKALPISNTK